LGLKKVEGLVSAFCLVVGSWYVAGM